MNRFVIFTCPKTGAPDPHVRACCIPLFQVPLERVALLHSCFSDSDHYSPNSSSFKSSPSTITEKDHFGSPNSMHLSNQKWNHLLTSLHIFPESSGVTKVNFFQQVRIFVRFYDLFLLSVFSHTKDRAFEQNRPHSRKKKVLRAVRCEVYLEEKIGQPQMPFLH